MWWTIGSAGRPGRPLESGAGDKNQEQFPDPGAFQEVNIFILMMYSCSGLVELGQGERGTSHVSRLVSQYREVTSV